MANGLLGRQPAGLIYRVALNWSFRPTVSKEAGTLRAAAIAQPAANDPESMPEVAAALERLSPDHRAVVVLRVWLDWSEAEVAAACTSARWRELTCSCNR